MNTTSHARQLGYLVFIPLAVLALGSSSFSADKAEWKEFCSKPGEFCVSMPGTPEVEAKQDEDGRPYHEYSYADETGGIAYIVGYRSVIDEMELIDNEAALLAIFRAAFIKDSKRLVSERKSPWKTHAGVELVLEIEDDLVMSSRMLIVDSRFYSIICVTESDDLETHKQDVRRFFDSFRLVDIIADLPQLDRFQTEEGRFQIGFPVKPVIEHGKKTPGEIELTVKAELKDGTAFRVAYMDLPEDAMIETPKPLDQLRIARDSLLQGGMATLVSQQELHLGPHPALQSVIRKKNEDKTMILRGVAVRGRIYQIAVVGSEQNLRQNDTVAKQFFESFTLLSVASKDGELHLSHVEACYSRQGPKRPTLVYYPYDTIEFRCHINGLEIGQDGHPDFEWMIALLDKDHKAVVKHIDESKALLPGVLGSALTFHPRVNLTDEFSPGEYTFLVVLKDRIGGRESHFTRSVTVLPTSFQIVDLKFSRDEEGKVFGPAGGRVGDSFYFHFRTIGFDRSEKKIDVSMTADLIDSEGQSILDEPLKANFKSDDEDSIRESRLINFWGKFDVADFGNYRLLLTVKDQVTREECQRSVPIQVIDSDQ